MNKKLKAAWIKALKSGRYKQARDALKEESAVPHGKPGYCCLGVLATISKAGKWGPDCTYQIREGRKEFSLEGELGKSGRKFFGIPSCVETKLIEMNDRERANFKAIAKHIRKTL